MAEITAWLYLSRLELRVEDDLATRLQKGEGRAAAVRQAGHKDNAIDSEGWESYGDDR